MDGSLVFFCWFHSHWGSIGGLLGVYWPRFHWVSLRILWPLGLDKLSADHFRDIVGIDMDHAGYPSLSQQVACLASKVRTSSSGGIWRSKGLNQ